MPCNEQWSLSQNLYQVLSVGHTFQAFLDDELMTPALMRGRYLHVMMTCS